MDQTAGANPPAGESMALMGEEKTSIRRHSPEPVLWEVHLWPIEEANPGLGGKLEPGKANPPSLQPPEEIAGRAKPIAPVRYQRPEPGRENARGAGRRLPGLQGPGWKGMDAKGVASLDPMHALKHAGVHPQPFQELFPLHRIQTPLRGGGSRTGEFARGFRPPG